MIAFDVVGRPEPKGSMRAFVRGGRAVVTSDNPRLKAWQTTVTHAAAAGRVHVEFVDEPVAIQLGFRLPRPKALPKRRDTPHTSRPDIDKLTRAVLDALTGEIWADDSQVAYLHVTKRYAQPDEPTGVSVLAFEVEV